MFIVGGNSGDYRQQDYLGGNDIRRNIYLVFIPVLGREHLKPLKFPK
jgi:hypothetical protein